MRVSVCFSFVWSDSNRILLSNANVRKVIFQIFNFKSIRILRNTFKGKLESLYKPHLGWINVVFQQTSDREKHFFFLSLSENITFNYSEPVTEGKLKPCRALGALWSVQKHILPILYIRTKWSRCFEETSSGDTQPGRFTRLLWWNNYVKHPIAEWIMTFFSPLPLSVGIYSDMIMKGELLMLADFF